MEEHKMLYDICQKIGYEPKYDIDSIGFYEELDIDISNISGVTYNRYVNVREIIFTSEFMELLDKYYYKKHGILFSENISIRTIVKDPVGYLAKLIGLN